MRKLLSLIIITITALGKSQTKGDLSCEETCYDGLIKNRGNMENEELCKYTNSFVFCVNIVCEKPELSPDMKPNLQTIVEKLKISNFTCDILSCEENCYRSHLKRPRERDMTTEELCRETQRFVSCVNIVCEKPALSPVMETNLQAILKELRSNFYCYIDSCEENCYYEYIKKPKGIMSNEELCRASQNFVNCVNIKCKIPELSPGMNRNLQAILAQLERSNFICEITTCQDDCYNVHIKKNGSMNYIQLCRAKQNFVTCVKDECKMPELHPRLTEKVQLIVEELKKHNISCEISTCTDDCYNFYIKTQGSMNYIQLCSAAQNFTTCVENECKNQDLSPEVMADIKHIINILKTTNLKCEIKY